MIYSVIIGPMLNFNNRPIPQDSKEYWVKTYGPDLGEAAYKLYLDTLNKS